MNTIKVFSVSIICTALVFGSISSARCAAGGDEASSSNTTNESTSTPTTTVESLSQPTTKASTSVSEPANKDSELAPAALKDESSSENTSVKPTQKVTVKPWVKYHKVSRQTNKKGVSITVVYPRFTGEPKEAIAKLNKLMKKTVNNNMPGGEAAIEGESDYTYSCDFGVSTVSPELISIDLNFYSYTGGAHGNGFTVPFNYQLTDKGPREITIKNLFGRTPNVKALQNLVRPKLSQTLYPDGQYADDEWINTGTEDLDCFQCISLDKNGVTFNFQSYQVACYAAGAPSVTFKYHELANLFDASSPLYSKVLSAKLKASKKHVASSKRLLQNKVASRAH